MEDKEDQKAIKLWMGVDQRISVTFANVVIFMLYCSIMVKWIAVAFVALSVVPYWLLIRQMARQDPYFVDRILAELKAERRAKAEDRTRK